MNKLLGCLILVGVGIWLAGMVVGFHYYKDTKEHLALFLIAMLEGPVVLGLFIGILVAIIRVGLDFITRTK